MSSALPRPAAGATRRLAATALALPLGLGALTGCGAGFEAVTYQERSSADAVNDAVGAIAVRNLAVAPGTGEAGAHDVGDDAEAQVTLVNDGDEDDRLVGASSEAAASVQILEEGEEVDAVEIPRLQTTGGRVQLVLVGLTEPLLPGSAVEITLQFERNGEVRLLAPVATTGEYDEDREKSGNFHPPGEEDEGGGGLSEAGEESTEQH